jgi:hypothetical protein
MLLYVAITHPVDGEIEEKIEDCIQDWYQNQRLRWELGGVLPYDPVLREIAIDVGNIPPNQVVESLRAWLSHKAELDESDYALSDHSSIEDLSQTERIEHFRHKLLYLLGSIRRLNHTLGSERMRQIEYLLGGIATEAADLLPTQHSIPAEPPLEEGWSRKLDEFWKSL